ncbi:MAG: class I SAM-dependent methyltransferase [Bacteroidia bacterium]|nr:class I SAM-dependent methyltransferase [Bacteroidia bacterium]
MSLTKEELNKIAHEYHNNDVMQDKFIEDECQFHTYNWVFDNMKGCKNVLEMGYGEGNFTNELVKRNFNPTIIDGSDVLLDKAKSLYGDKVNVAHALFEEYIPETKFDCVLATHVLEHVDEPVALLKHMKNWITPNGKIIIIVPNKESIHRQLSVIMGLQPALDTLGGRDKLVGHQRVYSLQTLENDVIKAGLKVSDTCGFFLKVLPNSMMLDYSKELIVALNKISPLMPKNLLANIALIAHH